MLIARRNNKIVNSPHYAKILREYNERLARDGKVNASKFFNEIIKELIPNISLRAWHQYLARYKTFAGAITETAANSSVEEDKLAQTVITMAQAQNLALRKALDIGLSRLKELGENPGSIPFEKAIDLIFKVMKAQDSRARVIKEVRQDVREQEKFEKLLNDEAYGSSE